MSATAHTAWCTDHVPADMGFRGQCCSKPIDVAPHAAVWLTRTGQGTLVIVDGPPTGLELTVDEAGDLSDAIHQLRDAARTPQARRRAQDTTGTALTSECPPWCTSGPHARPEAMHAATVTAGTVSVRVDQCINPDGTPGSPVLASLDGVDTNGDLDAQRCRDLSAALLEAARFIDAVTL